MVELISSDVKVTSPLPSNTLSIIDFLPSGTWLPLYSSINLTSLTLFLIAVEILLQVTSSLTKIDKSFSTNGTCDKCVNLLSREALGTNNPVSNSNTATLVRLILASLIVLIETNPSLPTTSCPSKISI